MKTRLQIIIAAVTGCLFASAIAFAAVGLHFSEVGGVGFDTGLTIGATGAAIGYSYDGSQTVDIVSIPATTCVDQAAITVTGAGVNDVCSVGPPAAPTTGLALSCFVSATDNVKIRACAINGASAVDPASATYYVRVTAK